MSNVDLKALVAQMTLEEKVDQLFQLASIFYVKEKAEITGPINHFGLDDESIARVGTMLGGVGAAKAIEIQKKHIEGDSGRHTRKQTDRQCVVGKPTYF